MNAKKLLALFLSLVLLLSLAACGSSGSAAPAATAVPTEVPAPTEAPAPTEVPAAEEPAPAAAVPAYVEEAISPYKEMLNRESDPTMQALYAANDLATVLEKHNSITVTMKSYQADGSVSLTEVVEVTNDGDGGYDLTVMRITSRGTGIGTGNSRDGYFVWKLADGTLQAQLSQPEEFLFMAQEEYLDSLFYADYSNVTSAEQNGKLYITADMSYAGEAENYKEYFWADSTTKEITAMEERYQGPDGEMRNDYNIVYDKSYNGFPPCDALNQAKNAADAADLTLVFVAPEYSYYSTVTYRMSAAIAKNLDTDGYFKIYSSPNFDPNSRMDTIVMNGDTTLYVLLLSYETAIKDMENNPAAVEPEPTAAPTPAPAASEPTATPAPTAAPAPELVITKNPTAETVNAGGQAVFIAKANNATAITWLFAGPDNTIVLAKDAPNYFGCAIYGLGTSTLTVANIPSSMNGWRIQCKFDGNGGPKWTSVAFLTVNSGAPVPVPVPTPSSAPAPASDLAAEAEALAWDNLYSIASRTQSYGWNMGSMSNFSYDSSVQTAQYDITATYSGMNIKVSCRSYPQQHSYQPSSIWVYLNGSEIFSDSFAGANESQAWAAFINDIAAIAGRNTPAPAPAPAAVSRGEFVGTTGTVLKLVVKWSASDNGNGTSNLTLNAYVEASTLHSSSFANDLCFQIGSDVCYATTNRIEDNTTNLVQTPLGSCTAVVANGNLPVVVSWVFNGVYSGQNIGTVQASAILPLGG